MRVPTLKALRRYAVARTTAVAPDLLGAIVGLGFVQLDPIRAPARAADLMLRHRCAGYGVGDLDRAYPALPLAEDYLHVYGVMPAATQALLHPRGTPFKLHVEREHPRLAAKVLAHVARHGDTHPRDLDAALGRTRMVGGWGGQSAASTRMLEALHYRGKLKVARRVNGVKVYALAPPRAPMTASAQRADALLNLLLRLYAPLPERSFWQLARMVTESSLSQSMRDKAFARACAAGTTASATIDGVRWLWPADELVEAEPESRVRAFAPFDPAVWDRRRFAAFWGWEYRLEAYTPPAKRVFGHYALPLLWRDDAVGWANASVAGGTLAATVHFAKAVPKARIFTRELESEFEALRSFVGAERLELRMALA
jgi:uncharacterized protein YcaQ